MAMDVAMNDMEIDFDMDGDVDPEIARLQAEAEAINASAEGDAMNGVEEVQEEGEVDASAVQSTKVHVRGVNKLNTYDLRRMVEEHYSLDLFKKVEWIDDNSANLQFDTPVAAAEFLDSVSAGEALDSLQLRLGKPLSTQPDVEIYVRQAIEADVKAPGAKDRSAFYLFNKEWDPDNPDNVRPGNRKRRWQDDDFRDRKYRRRDYGDDNFQRRSSRDQGNFHEDMYDDKPRPSASVRKSTPPWKDDRRRRSGGDLITGQENGRLRNRSASPGRDGDGRYGFADDQPRRATARPRSRTPERLRPSRDDFGERIRAGTDNYGARDKVRTELFPDKKRRAGLTNGHSHNGSIESFGTRPSSSASTRELFPDKVAVHRRQQAKDLHPDDVAEAIGKYSIDGESGYFAYGRSGRRPDERPDRRQNGGEKDLFSRINGGPQVESSYGRLQDRPSERRDAGFSIRGAGKENGSDGFSILGASRDKAENPLVKELFPVKAGGGGDLFDGRIKGRASRRRAEDLF